MYEQNSRDTMQMTDYNEKRSVLRSQSSGPRSPTYQDGENPAVRDLLVYFARHSTMHGIPSIVGSRLYRGRRLFWCGVVCVMALLLATVIYWQMSDFYRYPTVTSVNVQYVTEQDFPAVTICDLNIFGKRFVEDLDPLTLKRLAYLTENSAFLYPARSKKARTTTTTPTTTPSRHPPLHPPPPPSDSWEGERDTLIVKNIFKKITTMIQQTGGGLTCSWGDFHWEDCSVGLTPRKTEMGMCFTVNTRNILKNAHKTSSQGNNNSNNNNNNTRSSTSSTSSNNNSSSSSSSSSSKVDAGESEEDTASEAHGGSPVRNALRGLSLLVSSESEDIPYRLYHSGGFKVVLHDPREDPLPRSRGFVIGSNCSVEVQIEKHVRIGLEKPFLAFGSGRCVDVDRAGFVNPLKRYSFYTKEACETECFIDSVIRECQCRHFLHPGNETQCSFEKLKSCLHLAEANHYGGGAAKNECHCPMPCKQNIFSSAVSSASLRTTARFKERMVLTQVEQQHALWVAVLHLFFPDPIVTTIQQVPVYSLEGLLGSIGGQVGLFMGFSLVTVAEMCELIFLLCTRGRHLFSEETRQVLTQHTPGPR